VTHSSIYQPTYINDEHLSHYLWHIAIVGLAVLVIYSKWRAAAGAKTVWWMSGIASLVHGVTLFCIFLEGQTVMLGLL
jgi:hypothetical protein